MNSSFLYHAWGLYNHKCTREEYKGNLLEELIRVDNMFGKLRISLIFINLALSKSLSLNHPKLNYNSPLRIQHIG